MEFIQLSRHIKVQNPKVATYAELREMEPVWFTHDIKLVEEDANLRHAEKLASEGHDVVRMRRKPPFEKYLHREDFPRRVLHEMTTRCNFRCRMCPQQDLKRPRVDMPGPLYRKLVDEIDSYGVEGIWLYHFGESLMHPEFRENLLHVSTKKNLGVIWLSTNGRFLNEEFARLILGSNVDYLNVSANAVTEATYDTVASPGNFRHVQDNLERFYSLKGSAGRHVTPYLRVQMIDQETTRHEVDAFIAAHYRRADIVSINMLEHLRIANNAYGYGQRRMKPLTSCSRVSRNDCFICSNGHVTICDEAYNAEIFLGDVNTESLHEIWNGKRRREILRLNAEGRMSEVEFCRTCPDHEM